MGRRFELVGWSTETVRVELDPEEYRGMSATQRVDAIGALLAELAPGVNFNGFDIQRVASELAA